MLPGGLQEVRSAQPAKEKVDDASDDRAPKNQGGRLHRDHFPKDAGEAPEENKKIELEESGQNLASTLQVRVTGWGFDPSRSFPLVFFLFYR